MQKQDVAERIRQFIANNFYIADPTGLTPQLSFYEEGIIDSTGVLEVVSFLEETFGITIDDSEMLPENLDSLQGLNDFVERKLSGPSHLRLLPSEEESPVSHPRSATSAPNPVSSAQRILVRGDQNSE